MKKVILLLMLLGVAYGKNVTSSSIVTQIYIISNEIDNIAKHLHVKYNKQAIKRATKITTNIKARSVWQKTYEIMLKINLLKARYNIETLPPVNITPTATINLNLIYEQIQRIITELHIVQHRMGIARTKITPKKVAKKTLLDLFNCLSAISATLDHFDIKKGLLSSIFGEHMRILGDIALILKKLHIDDKTVPAERNLRATVTNIFKININMLETIKQLQISSGMNFVNYNVLKTTKPTISDLFSTTQMIIAEIQTLKKYLGIKKTIPPAVQYKQRSLIEIEQLVSWNLRKISLVDSLLKQGK